jgi:osmoprotectant transport system ATP-binding protein
MIEFKNVKKIYAGNIKAVDDVSFKIENGELFVLIGRSGCGKTTVLKMINRLLDSSEGSIFIDGKPIKDFDEIELRRKIGYVIQGVGLFPHLTIEENIKLPMKINRWSKERQKERLLNLIDLCRIDRSLLKKYPNELSGGQRQRVGVARGLAVDPPIILMDEPFGALDPITRLQLQDYLLEMQKKVKKTIVFVTHDITEAMRLADRIAVMDEGKIIQLGTVEEIIKQPANDFVLNMIGKDRYLKSLQFKSVKEATEKIHILEDRNELDIKNYMLEKSLKKVIVFNQNKERKIVFLQENGEISTIDYFHQYVIYEEEGLSKAIEMMLQYNQNELIVVNGDEEIIGTVSFSGIQSLFQEPVLNDYLGDANDNEEPLSMKQSVGGE